MRLRIAALFLIFATETACHAADVDSTLKALQDVGQKLNDFSADIRQTENDGLANDRIHAGRVYFQRTADGSARIHVILDQRISNGKISNNEKNEFLLDGPILIDRNYRTKSQAKHTVLKEGQKLDLFKIGKGPFPLPIGQDPAEVQRAFDVKVVPPGKDDLPKSTHAVLTPKPGSPLERKFKSIDIWVDDATHMPMRVDTVDKQGKYQSTELSKLVLNPRGGLKDADFALPPIDNSWNRSVDDYHD